MRVTITLRDGTASAWTIRNPILKRGEPGFEIDTNKLKIGDGIHSWADLDYVSGAGLQGDSAYEIAVSHGFIGTEVSWLASLVGPAGSDGSDGANGTDGADGTNGTNGVDGQDGADGVDGLSAYQIAVANGFVGTESAWLASLHGSPGADGADGADGTNGTDGADGLDGAQGPPGPSGETYPLAGYGLISASIPLESASGDSNHGPNWTTRLWVPAGKAITAIGTFVTIPGSVGSGYNGFAVYDDAGNKIDETPTDVNLWTADHDWAFKALTTPIAAEETGRFVRIVSVATGTDPWVAYWTHGGMDKIMQSGYLVSNHRRAIAGATNASNRPSTLDLTTGSTFNYVPVIVLA